MASRRVMRAAAEKQVLEGDGDGRLDDHRRTQGDADVVSSADFERLHAVRRKVVGHLFAGDARRGFHGGPHDERIAVREAADDASGVVRRRESRGVHDRVVVLRAAHPRRGESAAELHPL